MSSTNRGGQRSDADNYPTPAWPVRRLLEKLPLPGGPWLEPGGGAGHIIRAVNAVRSDVTWWTAELREECREPLIEAVGSPERVVIGDYLVDPPPVFPGVSRFKVAIGNPPFGLAMAFIEQALAQADIVAMLLRLNFMGSELRWDWMRHYPADLYVLPNRPSFRGYGSDSIEYAWYVWEQGKKERTFGLHRMLDITPLDERNAEKPPRMAPVPKKKFKGKLIGEVPEGGGVLDETLVVEVDAFAETAAAEFAETIEDPT